MRPRDLEWSDCGPWPSTSDDPGPRRPCARCGRLGTQSLLATGGLCWTCAAQEYRCRLEADAAREDETQTAGDPAAQPKEERSNGRHGSRVHAPID
jgi:hypothetical protein